MIRCKDCKKQMNENDITCQDCMPSHGFLRPETPSKWWAEERMGLPKNISEEDRAFLYGLKSAMGKDDFMRAVGIIRSGK